MPQKNPALRDAQEMLWVVLPAYNEGSVLTPLCRSIQLVLDKIPHRIVLVNDGSTDHSFDALPEQLAGLPVTILTHPVNQGLGVSVLRAFRHILDSMGTEKLAPASQVIAVMDADLTHPPALLPVMLRHLQGRQDCDVVIASRYRPGSAIVGLSSYRRILSWGASLLFRLFVPIQGVKDYTCGYRMYRAALLQQAMGCYGEHLITETGFTCMAELLIKLRETGARFCEIPFILRYDSKVTTSKMRVFQTILRSLPLLLGHSYFNRDKK